MTASPEPKDWRHDGVRIVRAGALDPNTPQTPGMSREAALSCVVVRSGQEPVVVNLDLPDVADEPERVRWVDDLHS